MSDVSADDIDKYIYREEIKLFVVRQTNLRRNMEKSFGLIWGQCSTQLQATIKGITAYSDKYDDLDILWLIKELKKIYVGNRQHIGPATDLAQVPCRAIQTQAGRD